MYLLYWEKDVAVVVAVTQLGFFLDDNHSWGAMAKHFLQLGLLQRATFSNKRRCFPTISFVRFGWGSGMTSPTTQFSYSYATLWLVGVLVMGLIVATVTVRKLEVMMAVEKITTWHI